MQRYIHDTLHSLCVYYVKGKSKKKLFWQISEETYSLTKWSIQPQNQLVARDATIRSPHKCKLLTNRLQDSKTLEFVPTIGSEIQWSDLRKTSWKSSLKGVLVGGFELHRSLFEWGADGSKQILTNNGNQFVGLCPRQEVSLECWSKWYYHTCMQEHLNVNALFPRTRGYKQEFSRMF